MPPRTLPALSEGDILSALMRPIWPDKDRRTIFDIVKPGESVCFVVSDQTRRTAADMLLPVIVNRFIKNGCRPNDLFILFATGIHRSPKPSEVLGILGDDMFRQFEGRIFMHDPDDAANLVEIGTSKRGHRIRFNRRAWNADRLIPIGAASYHYHAGFGGGRKSLIPGLAARDTIAFNHSLTLDPKENRMRPGVDIGMLDGNPVAEEMLEAARLCEPDIIVNTVLTPNGKLAGVFSGDLDAAHRAACKLVEQVDRVEIDQPADIVIASAETAPNWIQSHKALFNAHRAVRNGGCVILIAPCPEGIGDERFRYWITRDSVASIYRELRSSSEVLGQTALSTRTRGKDAILVTTMNQKDITDLGIRTAPDIKTAIEMALAQIRVTPDRKPTYYLMPEARHTVPFTSR
jgi:nickel-dependent lactate racemase